MRPMNWDTERGLGGVERGPHILHQNRPSTEHTVRFLTM